MNFIAVSRIFLTAALLVESAAAIAANGSPPAIDMMPRGKGETVCQAWPASAASDNAQESGLSWVGYPAAVKPFGMRGYIGIDGQVHPLRQVAYARQDGLISIYYRSLGDRHYDVYLTLTGLADGELKGDGLAGTLVVSRFGLFSEIKLAGKCG